MSNTDIKMSDVFEGEVKVNENYGEYHLEDDAFFKLDEHSHIKAAAHAINSHDALIEQNKALNEVINEIRAMVTDVQDGFDVTGGDAEILNVINDCWSKQNDNHI